jgi:hypothetical protein
MFAISAQNIVKNGNFAQFTPTGKPTAWRLSWAKPPGVWTVDKANYVSKPGSLLIENTRGQDTIICQVIKLKPNTKYRFSCWMKGENIKSSKKFGGARFYLQDKGKIVWDGSPAGLFKRAVGSFDWGKVEFSFNSNSFKSGSAVIYLTLRFASGKVWYDDVIIEEADSKIPADKLGGRLFPVDFQSGTYSVCEGMPGMLFLDIKCGAEAKKNGLKLLLDLPEEFKFSGSCPWLPTHYGKNGEWLFAPDKFTTTSLIRNKKKYLRYTIDVNPLLIKRARPNRYSWGNFIRLFIAAQPGFAGKTGIAYWSLVSEKQKSKEQRFAVTSLPEIKLRKLNSDFGMLIGYLWSQTCPFPEINNAYIKYWNSLSKEPQTLKLFYWDKKPLAVRKRIEKNFNISYMLASKYATPRFHYTRMYQELCKGKLADKFPPIVNYKGEKDFTAIAPYYLIEDPQGLFWDKYFVEEMKQAMAGQRKTDMIIYDCEPGAKDHGYSRENLRRFAKFAKLNETPSISDIRSKYASRWFEFRVVQHAKIIKKFCQAVHKHFPGVKAALSSDPIHVGDSPLAQWCGVDVRLSDDDVDVFMNMPYYSGVKYFDDVRLNVKILKKPNFPFIDPTEKMEHFYKRYTPQSVKQNIVATAALGCTGIAFWPSDAFDGRYLRSIAAAFYLASVGEKFYKNKECSEKLKTSAENVLKKTFVDSGKKLTVEFPDFSSSVKTLLHSANGEYIITAINYNLHNACILKLAIPTVSNGQYIVQEVESGKIIDGLKNAEEIRRGFLAKINSGNVALIKIFPADNIPASAAGIIHSNELQKELAVFRARLAAENRFKSLKKGNSAIRWSALTDSDGMPKLKMQTGTNSIYISPQQGAEVVGWKKTSGGEDYLFFKSRGFLGQLIFYDTKQRTAPYHFNLEKIDIVNGCPSGEFSYTVPAYEGANAEYNPLEGLMVKKIITLRKDGSIKSVYKFTNKSPRRENMKFGFRVKNYPRIGGRLAGNKKLSAISQVKYQTPDGEKTIKAGADPANWLVNSSTPPPGLIRAGSKVNSWKNSPLAAIAGTGSLRDKMIFKADEKLTAGYLVWWGMATYTVEMLSRDITLPYGKSIIYEYIIYSK